MDNQEVEPRRPAQLDNAKLELNVGMKFDSFEEAYNFYSSYAGRKGFSVRRSYCHRRKGVKIDQKFVCSKEGYREKCKKNVKFHRAVTGTGCLACIIVVLQKNGKVKVKKFEAQHNHKTLTPQEAHMLRSQRRTTRRTTYDTQVPQENVANVIGITSKHVGGRDNLGYLDVGFQNNLHQKRQRMMESGVAGAIAQYFQKMQVSNPSFYFAFQFHAEDMLTNIFWVDARMISDYGHFGDVVLFNTIYDSPFATFLGVNHHNQTVVFGAALMYDETFDSFIWLFKSFPSVMSGKRPKSILPNQSTALANAIATSMPDTNHQLSIWHVYQDAIKHLSNVFNVTQCFKQDFSKRKHQDEDEEVFCRGWEKMLEDYNLKDNKWLQDLFAERKKWARVYERHIYYANMNTSQRSEVFNAFTPRHPVSQLDLIRFLEQFEGGIEDY